MALRWSAQLSVSPPAQTQRLPGDKISLPPSALEQLLAAAPLIATDAPSRSVTSQFDPFNRHTFAAERRARELAVERQQQLPHPLTFRLVNPDNGRVVHAGIREFSTHEGEVGLSPLLRESLGFQDSDFEFNEDDSAVTDPPIEGGSGIPSRPEGYPTVTIHAAELSKGTYVRLRPLEPGYDVEDWKALLERYLRLNFTTLTVGEMLSVPSGRHDDFRFLVDKVQPEGDAICIVDTDLEVDIEALDEEQARETLRRRLAKTETATGGSSAGGRISQGEEKDGQILPGDYVDYELRDWDRKKILGIELLANGNVAVDILISPFSARQRSRPRSDEHVLGDFSNTLTKQVQLQPTNVELEGAEALYISVHFFSQPNGEEDEPHEPAAFRLRTVIAEESQPEPSQTEEDMHDAEDVQCKNCHQWVPSGTFFLHENFCLRNNVVCPKCDNVFQRRSPEWENHWHCPDDDDAHGDDACSKSKHALVFHTARSCPGCDLQAASLPELAQHRTTMCPAKSILCQFCHLEVPQKGDGDPDVLDAEVLLSGLTPHEIVDGGRTTECHLCNKIIRLRDMKTHLRHHELDRMSRPPPRICINSNCSRTIDGAGRKSGVDDSLGLCGVCFGPLYADLYDPEGKALRRRIERRYLSQMLTGCNKPWCRNEYCKTGRANLSSIGSEKAPEKPSVTPKDALALVKPLIDAVSVRPGIVNTARLFFCTDESTQHRRTMADLLATQEGGQYENGWCIAAVEFGSGDLGKAQEWLENWAPKKLERTSS